MWPLLRVGLHALPPETAHSVATQALRFIPRLYRPEQLGQECWLMGLRFPNRIGLAAGFDKNGSHLNQLAKLGFGCIEIGTVTPKPQSGSAPPRLFRLPQLNCLINRMGFNNVGSAQAARLLAQQGGSYKGILGCNIGCNRDTPGHEITKDYMICLRELYGVADYFTINISSPNTPSLRMLHNPLLLNNLLYELTSLREQLSVNHKHTAPLLVKVSPDLDTREIDQICEMLPSCGIEGVIATNTTSTHSAAVQEQPYGGQPGGVSGGPLRNKADRALAHWRKLLPSDIVLIGVGGIINQTHAQSKLAAGADLLQIYTGLIYQGPSLIAECAKAVWEHEQTQNAQA